MPTAKPMPNSCNTPPSVKCQVQLLVPRGEGGGRATPPMLDMFSENLSEFGLVFLQNYTNSGMSPGILYYPG